MRYSPILFCIIVLFPIDLSAQAQQKKMAKFAWLIGTWKHPSAHHYETWSLSPEGSYLIGKGFEITRGDTLVNETLAIEYRQGKYYYMANVPHNQNPVLFRMKTIKKGAFVCENPKHDFPKKITYELLEEKKLSATIEGNGRSHTYSFERR